MGALDKHKGSELIQSRVLLGQILPEGEKTRFRFYGSGLIPLCCLHSHQQVQSDTSETQLMANQETSKWQAGWQRGEALYPKSQAASYSYVDQDPQELQACSQLKTHH